MFPPEWYVDVTLERQGPRDRYGNRPKVTTIDVPHCLIAPGGTISGPPLTGVADSDPVLYRHANVEPPVSFQPSDVITIPPGSHMSGRWAIKGRPKLWPFGWEVNLVRDDGKEKR